MANVLEEILELLTSGITSVATGIGTGVQSLVTKIFMAGEGTSASPYTLSVFGGVIVIFAGIALAIGLCRWVMSFVTSLGSNH